ncbi:MAG: hypothetical protein ABSC65_03220 [Acidobacteriaceae bacterium]|jgi:hypothetical protein
MNDQSASPHDQLAVTYLQQLQALAFEISVAMDAIARNAVASFQESVAKQEMLCAVLATMADSMREKQSSSTKAPLILNDPSVELKIRAASGAIRDLNLQYAALLKHSGRSLALLVSLCRSHTGQHLEAGGSRSKRQTWSCEM